MAQHGEIAVARCGGPASLTTDTQVLTSAPRIVRSTSSSCTYSALENTPASVSIADVKRLTAVVPCVIVSDVPDGCAPMKRLKHATAEVFEECENVLYEEHGTCVVHIAHNIVVAAVKEDDVVGHAHAFQYVLSLAHRKEHLLGALRHLVESELDIVEGCPVTEDTAHVQSVVNHLLLRARMVTRSRAGGSFDVSEVDEGWLATVV